MLRTFVKKLIYISLFIVALTLVQSAYGLQVTGLYEYRVAVNNESDTERDRAFEEALRAVILKITGEHRLLEHPNILEALGNAQSYVESISYVSETAGRSVLNQENELVPLEEQRYIEVSFATSLIQELLVSANIPLWDSNRPSVLVWMVLQNSEGERTLLTPETNSRIITFIQSFADERAIPIIFPVLDFEDRQNLSEDTVWSLDKEGIMKASERYGADSILAGRLHFAATNQFVGLWQFIFQDDALIFDGFEETLEAYLYGPLDRVTNQLATYFGIVPEGDIQETVRLRVEGIRSLSSHSALLSYINGLGVVDSVNTVGLDGERLELELDLVGDSGQLFELITLDRDLLPIESSQLGGRGVLHYRWTR